jgi:hypothetical protein
LLEGAVHGQVGGFQDIELIDFGCVDLACADLDLRILGEDFEEEFAGFGGELFGVVEAGERIGWSVLEPGEGEDDGGGDHGAGEGAASGLIDTGDAVVALGELLAFVGEAVGGGQGGGD